MYCAIYSISLVHQLYFNYNTINTNHYVVIFGANPPEAKELHYAGYSLLILQIKPQRQGFYLFITCT